MSNEPTIEQKNETICDFMGGYRKIERPDYHINVYKGPDGIEWETGTYLKYHSDWNWLMPVFRAIREKAFALRNDEKANKLLAKLNTQLLFGTIANVHLHAFRFIEYINNQSTTANEQN